MPAKDKFSKDSISKMFDNWVESLNEHDPIKQEVIMMINASTRNRILLECVFMGGIENELRDQLKKQQE